MDPSLKKPSSGEAASAAAPVRPQRPFTEYNVFFQLERESLLQSREDGLSNGAYTVKRILDQERQVESPEKAALRPRQYRHLVLPSDWYVVGSKYTGKGDPNSYRRDRKHRKTHGVISFVELTKLVSSKWKVVDPETKEYCRSIAQEEYKRYRKELDEFIKIYGAEAAKGKKRKPRKAKQVAEPKKPEEPQEIAEAESFNGECAFIPIDDDLANDIISIDPVHSPVRSSNSTLSKVAETDFEKSLGDGMNSSFYAPNRLNGQGNMNLEDRSAIQDQGHSAMYHVTPSSRTKQDTQRVSLNHVMGRSFSLPFNATNGCSGMMKAPAGGNDATFQERAVDGLPNGFGNSHSHVHGHNFRNQGSPQAFHPNNHFGEFGISQGTVTSAGFDQFAHLYKQDISRNMTQERSLELQRQLLSWQPRYHQPQTCLEQTNLSQFDKSCAIGGKRVSMENTRRSSMDNAFVRNRSSMSLMNASFRRSSLPINPNAAQASKEFPQLTVQQEMIMKNLVEQEKLRKSGDSTFGKMPIGENPKSNYPSAA
jgi:hypothetical protein